MTAAEEQQPLRILIVDDSEDDYVLMRDMLEDIEMFSCTTTWCRGYDDGLKASAQAYDVCLIDYILGGKNGVQLIEDAVRSGCQSPMIIFTARGNHHVDLEAMDKGAVDYLTKGEFNEALLERTIRYAMDRKKSELALAAANASLEARVAERTRELHAANKKLQHRQNTLQTLLHNAPVAIWMADSKQKINFINQTFLDIHGINKEAMLGADDYYTVLPDSLREQWRTSDTECLQDGVSHTREQWVDTHGEPHSFDIIKARVMGEETRLIGIGLDVSQQVELQAQMEHAQRLESLGILAGGIAHDFNNLLAVIMASAGLAERCIQQTGMVQDSLGRIISASQRAAELCKQMMSYAGRGDYQIKSINLSDMVTSITDLLRMSISHNITVRHDLASEQLLVDADGSQLQQVLMNLVINASEAIGENKAGQITIKTGQMMADRQYLKMTIPDSGLEAGEYCFIEVSDNGCGMSNKVKTHLFDPFFTTKFTGRGLGMSAILGIVRGHGGVIHLHSEEGQGTTIRILLPSSHRASPAADTAPATAAAQPSGWQGHGTALVVDDEPEVREVAAFLMQDMGFDVLQAEDGLVAVELFRQHRHDISMVILDLSMPNMNGEACFRELRKLQPDVKIILSSGYSKNESFTRFSDKGLSGFVQKPYKPETFEAEVQALFKQGGNS